VECKIPPTPISYKVQQKNRNFGPIQQLDVASNCKWKHVRIFVLNIFIRDQIKNVGVMFGAVV